MNNKLIILLTILTMAGSFVFADEPVAVENIPDDPDACAEILLQHFQKTEMTEQEVKLKIKAAKAKERAIQKEERKIQKIANKKKKLEDKANQRRQKAAEYEQKIQYRINKMDEKKLQLEKLIDVTTPEENTEPSDI